MIQILNYEQPFSVKFSSFADILIVHFTKASWIEKWHKKYRYETWERGEYRVRQHLLKFSEKAWGD